MKSQKNEFPHDWLKLVPWGEFDHCEGHQVFMPESGLIMVDKFKSLWHRMARGFKRIPIYAGHPDDPYFAGKPGHLDTRPYGYVKDMRAYEDGLFIRVTWTALGASVLEGAHLRHFSPRWIVRPLDNASEDWEPIELLSIGLTNTPNIPSVHIAEQSHLVEDCAALKTCLSLAKQQIAELKARVSLPNATITRRPSYTQHLRFADRASKSALLDSIASNKRSEDEPFLTTWSRAKRNTSNF